MELKVLPLAITMMLGPQIMSAIVFVTAPKAVSVSRAFIAGVAIATTAGVAIARAISELVGSNASLGPSSDKGSAGTIVQFALIALLLAAALKAYLGRETAEPPKWLGALQTADAAKAFKTGLLVILAMPSDVIIMLTVGLNLEQSHSSFVEAIPFIAATVLVAALPFLFYELLGSRARRAMPRVRDWMNEKSWLVNIIVYLVFVVLIAA